MRYRGKYQSGQDSGIAQMGGSIKSILGYSKNSPYKNSSFLDIFTPNGSIDMSNTEKNLIGIDNLGNTQFMKAGRKEPYMFDGNIVREIPLAQMVQGGLTATKAKKMLKEGIANGRKLSQKQKRYFGWVAGGKKQQGGNIYEGNAMEELVSFLFEEDEPKQVVEQQVEQEQENTSIDLSELEREKQQSFEEQQILQILFGEEGNPYQQNPSRYPNLSKFETEKVGNKEQYVYNFFLNKGYTSEISAGITANIKHESNFSPTALGDGGKAKGIAQWHPDRYSNLSKKFNLNDLHESLEALHYELQNSEKRAYEKIKTARSPEEAAYLVDRHFERSAGLTTPERVGTARNIYNTFTKK